MSAFGAGCCGARRLEGMESDDVAPAAETPWGVVRAPSGTFLTVREEGVVRARGIRYASAARFGAPRPYDYGDEPFRADTPSPACPQRHTPEDAELVALGFDEHCQRLSITRPDDTRTGLPVMVWIHGGSYVGGAGDLPHYDPCMLVREQSVIVVALTYRLGLFGYLGDGEERAANAGLLDQIAALDWVHRNIAAFGGDPGNVTVAGQSAGGQACWDLLLVPAARAQVRRAIVQSAPLGIVHGRGRAWGALVPPAQATEELRAATPEALAGMESGINRLALRRGRAMFMPFSARYVDPLPAERDLERQWAEAAQSVELLMGTTARETALFAGANARLRRLATPRRGSRDRVVPGPLEPLLRTLTRFIYRRDAERWVRRFRAAGGNAMLYTFEFGRREAALACGHVSELPLLFEGPAWSRGNENVGAGVTGPDLMATYPIGEFPDAARRMRAMWGAFLRDGVESDVVRGGVDGVVRVE